MVYSPQLFIGVQHTPDQLAPVFQLLEERLHPGIVIGTEACQSPITEGHKPAFTIFYNALMAYISNKGGRAVCLGRHEDCLYLDRREARTKDIVRRAMNVQEEVIKKSGVPVKGDLAEDFYKRSLKMLYDEEGFTQKDFLRDRTAIQLAREHEPEIIIYGVGHLGALYSPFSTADVKIIIPEGRTVPKEYWPQAPWLRDLK